MVEIETMGWKAKLARIPRPVRWGLLVLFLLVLWYGVIGGIRANIHIDLSARPGPADLPVGGSSTIGMAAMLLQQQVDDRAFTPNDPFFYPTALARRTPAFQESVIRTLAASITAIAAETPSADLGAAANQLSVPPQQWWLRAAMPPIGWPAEHHFMAARGLLRVHNLSLAAERPQPIARLTPAGRALLEELIAQLSHEAEKGQQLMRNQGKGSTTVQLASARGTAYASAMLLRGVKEENAPAIRLSGRAARWAEAQDSLDEAARLNPLVPGQADLVQAGYSMLLATNALRAILDGQP